MPAPDAPMPAAPLVLHTLSLGLGLLATACEGPGPPVPRPDVTDEAAAPPGAAFTDATAMAGLGAFRHERGAFGERWMPETFGAGAGFVDYDGDGWSDVLLVGGGTWPGHPPGSGATVPALELYRNDRNGTF